MSELRTRMIRDMTVRGFSPETHEAYDLNPLAQSHPRLVYGLLFQAASSTLLGFGHDPRHLGGDLGVTAVLHTWGQTLTQHVHVHCVVTAVGPGGARAP